ncbi:MAG: hypothetical protein AABX16_01280 [Nanoarchaeota archaeon]
MKIKKGDIFVMMFFIFGILLINSVFAVDVAYIVRNSNHVDDSFLAAFEDMNLEVTVIEDKNIASTSFSGYDFIFVGDGMINNIEQLPTHKPILLTNGKYASLFGFLKMGSVRQMSANQQLRIQDTHHRMYAYTMPSHKLGGAGLSYVYLPNRFREINVNTVATTATRRDHEIGDAVAYLMLANSRRCFFGINRPAFWTHDSSMLFNNCVQFVMSGGGGGNNSGNNTGGNGTNNNQTNTTLKHSVMIDMTYPNNVNGIRIHDEETGAYLLNQTANLSCNKKYKIDFRTINNGNFTENVNLTGMLANFNWKASKTGLAVGGTTTTGSKTINVTFMPGTYVLDIRAIIPGFMTNRSRTVRVVC